jgi:cytidylate kinase
MYRAAALRALRRGASMRDHAALARIAREASIELSDRGRGPIMLDGENVSAAIRAEGVSAAASVMSAVPEVRRALVREQRAIGLGGDCVVEGRDIGTVVFPDADLKIFLVATLEERARRRLRESGGGRAPAAGGAEPSREVLQGVMDAILDRDARDSTRRDSPLRRADDAIELDTTGLSIEEQVARVIDLARKRGAGKKAPHGGETGA